MLPYFFFQRQAFNLSSKISLGNILQLKKNAFTQARGHVLYHTVLWQVYF